MPLISHKVLVPVPGTEFFCGTPRREASWPDGRDGAKSLLRLPTHMGTWRLHSLSRERQAARINTPATARGTRGGGKSGVQSAGTKEESVGLRTPPHPCLHPTNQHREQAPTVRWGFVPVTCDLWPGQSSESFGHTAGPRQGALRVEPSRGAGIPPTSPPAASSGPPPPLLPAPLCSSSSQSLHDHRPP